MIHALRSDSAPWEIRRVGSEFFYQRGRTDIVAVTEAGKVFAFEAKLIKWREALNQAYRNCCFAHRSFVVLPRDTAIRASQYCDAFSLRGVGICYVDKGRLVVLQDAKESEPMEPFLFNRALNHIEKQAIDEPC